ncbi:MAG: class IV adenylate cyclase [Candidatus Nealsonbacteria bacterium]|nr:class IV adenylate cyclase [Candidatus Nealsonbacteria bacterium]
MPEEIEVKFLNIDPRQIERQLKAIGAKKVFNRLYYRRVFDFPDLRLDKKSAFLRLRDEGDRIMLAFKQRLGVKDHGGKINDRGMEEIEVEVNDFGKMAVILLKLGLIEKFYQENRIIRYQLGKIEFDIDFHPRLNPYLEIEAPSWKEIDRAIQLMGLDDRDRKIFSAQQAYKLAGINENDYQVMSFKRFIKKKKRV